MEHTAGEIPEITQQYNDPDRWMRYAAAILAVLPFAVIVWYPVRLSWYLPWLIPTSETLYIWSSLILLVAFYAFILMRRAEARYIAMVAVGWQVMVQNVYGLWFFATWRNAGHFVGPYSENMVLFRGLAWSCIGIAVALLLIWRKDSGRWCFVVLCVGPFLVDYLMYLRFPHVVYAKSPKFHMAPTLPGHIFTYMVLAAMFMPESWIPRLRRRERVSSDNSPDFHEPETST